MISLKRLEAMRWWWKEGWTLLGRHESWGLRAGLLRVRRDLTPKGIIVPTEALAPAIAKAEAEHARHRTLEQREVNRKRDGDANRAKQAAEPGLWRWRTWP